MEREREIARLVNVLRQTARMAMQSEWTGSAQDAAGYCAEQYNRVLGRLKELEPGIINVFEPLPPGSSLMVAAMACRQLGAYFEDEAGRGRHHWGRRGHAFRFDGSTLKDFWRESAQEMEDLGEFIRESVEEWARRRNRRAEHRPGPPPPPPPPEDGPTGTI
jgi:hypothetical protein